MLLNPIMLILKSSIKKGYECLVLRWRHPSPSGEKGRAWAVALPSLEQHGRVWEALLEGASRVSRLPSCKHLSAAVGSCELEQQENVSKCRNKIHFLSCVLWGWGLGREVGNHCSHQISPGCLLGPGTTATKPPALPPIPVLRVVAN